MPRKLVLVAFILMLAFHPFSATSTVQAADEDKDDATVENEENSGEETEDNESDDSEKADEKSASDENSADEAEDEKKLTREEALEIVQEEYDGEPDGEIEDAVEEADNGNIWEVEIIDSSEGDIKVEVDVYSGDIVNIEQEENDETEENTDENAEDNEEDTEVESSDEETDEETDEATDKKAEDESETTNENNEDEAEVTTEEDENSSDEEATEASEDVETFADEEDEDLDISDVYGTANGTITYDLEKGYYVLDVQAGFHEINLEETDIQEKWLAFALPNGVNVADELPSGVIQITMEGKTGVAVKIPNIKNTSSEYVHKDIPLTGEPDDNYPYDNLRMIEVDEDSEQYSDVGEVKSQRDIDFSVMQENPSIDLNGSIEGATNFDDDNIRYNLNIDVEAKNNAYEDIDNQFAAFELPEGVRVLNDEDISGDVKLIPGDDKEMVAVRLPELREDKEGSESYSLPVIGKSDEVVSSDSIQLYTFNSDEEYSHVGEFDGNINVDFSDMDQDWFFDSKSEVITDYPGVNDNQKGFRFNYTTRNLTLDDVDAVELEFNVPDAIEIEKPQYVGGGVDIDWDGNTATVDLGDLGGAEGYEGYFTALGNTSASLEDLKDASVKVTLFKDGEEKVETIQSPFVEGKYDENDFDTPPEDNKDKDKDKDKDKGDGNNDDDNNEDHQNNNGDGENNNGQDNDGNDDKESNNSNKEDNNKTEKENNNSNKENNNSNKENNNSNKENNNSNKENDNSNKENNNKNEEESNGSNEGNNSEKNKAADDNEASDDTGVTVEVDDDNDGGDEQTASADRSSTDDDGLLPDTASDNFTMLLVGGIFIVLGGGFMLVRRKLT